jgi:signal transduction histidine kinase/tetratricopeptide (TPR) repeat protein
MSEVVRAFDRARGEEVAIKILKSASPAVTLSAEFRYIASLNHPGVVSVYDFGLSADGRPYFTMELLEAGDLLAVAEEASLAALMRTVREAFRTLDFVHARGIVHADLKPSNILVGTTRGGEHYPKLLDFGVAWSEASEQHGGTVQFMAPEMFLRARRRDHRSDLYSMGVVLFELFTGEIPFDDPNVVALARHHLQTPAPDPRDRCPHLPGELAELTLRLLEKDPADRFQRGREVVSAIDAFLAKSPQPSTRRERFVVAAPEVRIAGGSRFVGHEQELTTLLDRASEIERAGGAVVVVSGESGAGKTRLVSELHTGAQLRGIACLGADLRGVSSGHEVVDRLAAAIATASEHRVAGASQAPRSEPIAASDHLILDGERLAAAAIDIARRRPLVLSIEGVEGLALEASRALRAFALRAAAGQVLVVATTQDSDAAAAREILGIEGAVHVALRRVSKSACAEILRSLLGEMDGAEAIVEHVYRESGGNPGAIDRVVHALAASDAIVLRRDTWVVATELGGRLPVLSAEAGLRKIAAALVARLGEREREVARVAANIGEQFDVEVLTALVVDADGVDESLRELVRAQVLEPVAGEASDPRWHRFRFGQRAIREVLRESSAPELSAASSRRIVTLLEQRRAEGASHEPETLARHLIALGRLGEAAEVAGGAIAAAESPGAEVVELLRRALAAAEPQHLEGARWCELAKALADIDRREGRADHAIAGYRHVAARAPASAPRLALAARRELGDLLMSRGAEDGEAVLRGALDEARALDAADLIGRAAYALADRLVIAGRHEEASRYVAEALQVSEQTGDRALSAQTLKLCATLNWLRGQVDEAERYARAAVEQYRQLGSPQGIAVSLGALANTLYTRGELDEARACYSDALEHAHEAGWLTGIGKLEASLAAVAYHVDDWDGAGEHQDAAIAILERVGNRSDQVTQLQGRAFIAIKRGDVDAARRHNQRALELAREAGYRKGEADVLGNLGEVSMLVGALDDAEAYLHKSLAIARSIGSASAELETERRMLEVELALHRDAVDIAAAARRLLERAEEVSHRREVPQIRRVAGIALARTRRPDDAKRTLDQAHAEFVQLGSRYEAARTVRIITELAASGLIIADDMEDDLRDACRVFRRLRAQPELDAARRLRERLGIEPSLTGMAAASASPRDSWLGSSPPPSEASASTMPRRVERLSSAPASSRPPPRSTEQRTSAAPPSSAPPPRRPELFTRAAVAIPFPEPSGPRAAAGDLLDLEGLLAHIIDSAIGAAGAERGFVIACDRAGQPSLRVSRGLGGLDLDDDLEMSRSAVGRVIATRAPVEWREDAPPRATHLGDSVALLGLQALLALPLIHRGQLWGVLYLDSRKPQSALGGARLPALEALAGEAAVTIHNARLFGELDRKNELMAAAVHQLRHPLDALSRCADLARAEAAGTPAERFTDAVRAHARRLSMMVERLLELASAEPAKMPASMVSVQVRDLVDAAVLQLRPLEDVDDVPLELNVPWGLPTVLGHRDQLIQVIASMLAAAVHHAEPGEPVLLEAKAVEAPLPLGERDPFFPPSARELGGDDAIEVVVRFSAGATAEDHLDELGLAIAREIVQHHGGSWLVEGDGAVRRYVAVLPALVPIADDHAPSSAL